MINEKEYYDLMDGGMSSEWTFEQLHTAWKSCFSHVLKSFKIGYTQKIIDSLFYDFQMDNWRAMHKQNTEYASYSKKKLVERFLGECQYTCDRMSYDRLFRTHWLFRQAFRNELFNH